jgi:hypothetical protein
MIMPVTDAQVETLRALLSDDTDRYEQLFGQLDRSQARSGYTALVTGAFCEAVERRFGKNYQPADVIAFVGQVRARSERIAKGLDPDVAERVIRVVYGDGSLADLSDSAVVSAQLVLLGGLIADEQLDDAELDTFLAGARKLADQLMS